MIEDKTIYRSPSPRFFATTRVVNKKTGLKEQIGLKKGPVGIYRKGDTLLYTQELETRGPEGYVLVVFRLVGITQNRLQVTIPPDWYKEYGIESNRVSVDYQDIGLFVKPWK